MSERIITMVPATLKPLDRFVAIGTLPMCDKCWLKDKCSKLKKGWIYEVKNVLGQVKHKCPIHGEVIVAEVEELGVPLVVPKKVAIEGATVTYTPTFCKRKDCPYWGECTGKKYGLRGTVKVKIVEVMEEVECPEGIPLVRVIGRPEAGITERKDGRRPRPRGLARRSKLGNGIDRKFHPKP